MSNSPISRIEPAAGMVLVRGSRFRMGSERHYREEAPVREVEVEDFSIDAHAVTNRDFARFVKETGYLTIAERPLDPALYPGAEPAALKPGAMVFRQPRGPARGPSRHWSQWWAYVPGACWRKPEGGPSVFRGRLEHPVVCVAFEDAAVYAAWAGKALPTEAQWEYAARGGLDGAEFTWGDEPRPGGHYMANTWQGEFPWRNDASDGYERTAPVGSFPPNGFGLYDMAGNVWEWTTSWYLDAAAPASPCCGAPAEPPPESFDPAQPDVRIPRKVVKGGSYLCDPNSCYRFRPAARQPQMIDTATTHIGFRCVRPIG
ncbi:MAG TPA: formylglycine-generating enzyme family protein [Caulobacteraceae bacterium]|jgi:formylglycine-generating enzyme required for sulfatase activity|nr:formylglycine-generating enzyme family protein [Caulobacteraceae bacterium]